MHHTRTTVVVLTHVRDVDDGSRWHDGAGQGAVVRTAVQVDGRRHALTLGCEAWMFLGAIVAAGCVGSFAPLRITGTLEGMDAVSALRGRLTASGGGVPRLGATAVAARGSRVRRCGGAG